MFQLSLIKEIGYLIQALCGPVAPQDMVSEISFLRTKFSFLGALHLNQLALRKFKKPLSFWGRHTSLLASINNQP